MVNRKKLLYEYKGNTADVDFSNFNGAIDTINKIASGDISLSKAIDNQYKFKSELGEVRKGNSKRTSGKNLEVIKNAQNLYNEKKQLLILLLNILKEFQKLKVEQNKKERV